MADLAQVLHLIVGEALFAWLACAAGLDRTIPTAVALLLYRCLFLYDLLVADNVLDIVFLVIVATLRGDFTVVLFCRHWHGEDLDRTFFKSNVDLACLPIALLFEVLKSGHSLELEDDMKAYQLSNRTEGAEVDYCYSYLYRYFQRLFT